ncbi:hypothetical protein TNCV_3661731 [Trichonephila clavipes]|nr:hypothetical protein TNCV_3661731 [Trichonephila clavipes]
MPVQLTTLGCCCCFFSHLISIVSDPGPRNSWKGARCTPVVSCSLEPHSGDRTILAQFHTKFEGGRPCGGLGSPTSLPRGGASSGVVHVT